MTPLSLPEPVISDGDAYFKRMISAEPRGISQRYLETLANEREGVSDKYVEALYYLCKYLENCSDPFIPEENIALFRWKGCDGVEYDSRCIRFELIMSAMYRGISYINESKPREALRLIRGICIEEIQNWTRRNELDLPLESTLLGCEMYRSIAMILYQDEALKKKETSGEEWNNIKIPYALYYWLYEESFEIKRQLEARTVDESIVVDQSFMEEIEKKKDEYYCNYVYYGCLCAEKEKTAENYHKRMWNLLADTHKRVENVKGLDSIKKKIKRKRDELEHYINMTLITEDKKTENADVLSVLPAVERLFVMSHPSRYVIEEERSFKFYNSIKGIRQK